MHSDNLPAFAPGSIRPEAFTVKNPNQIKLLKPEYPNLMDFAEREYKSRKSGSCIYRLSVL
jgi:hypothetical protein